MTTEELQLKMPNRGQAPGDFHLELFGEDRFSAPPVCSRCGQPCRPYSFARREWCKACLDEVLPDKRLYWQVWDDIVNSTEEVRVKRS